jgi:hypothetical protein
MRCQIIWNDEENQNKEINRFSNSAEKKTFYGRHQFHAAIS